MIEDKDFIQNLLNNCIKIKNFDNIYFVTSNNISRQLKYNKLLNKNKNIKIDLKNITFIDNIIIEIDKESKYFWINYKKIWIYFRDKYYHNKSYLEKLEIINDVLFDIFKLKNFSCNISTDLFENLHNIMFDSNGLHTKRQRIY